MGEKNSVSNTNRIADAIVILCYYLCPMQLKNDLLLRVARGEKTERTPVWLMRQAGRILPEYREVRSQMKDFVHLVQTPERAAEVTIQPVDILGVDAAIIFSDILVIPEAMGLPYQMVENQGPFFPNTIEKESDIARLKVAETADMAYTPEAIKITKKELDGRVPLIGFAGAPWTIFAYMVEGTGNKTFSKARGMLYHSPAMAHQLLQMITDSTINYLKAQIVAGADLVQIFDSWAGILDRDTFSSFALPYIKAICDAIQEVPKTVFAKGAFYALDLLDDLDCHIIGLDWHTPIAFAREQVSQKALQGNMDPALLYADPEKVKQATLDMLKKYPEGRHVANLGHGIYPDLPRESVKAFVETVKSYSYG